MLVLSRKRNEFVEIIVPPSTTPTKLRVGVVECRPAQARLGFDAPKEVQILREELPSSYKSNRT